MSDPTKKTVFFVEDDDKHKIMIHLLNIEEWAERYFREDLSAKELATLHTTLEEDLILNKAFAQALELQVLLKEHSKKVKFKSNLARIAAEHQASQTSIERTVVGATPAFPTKLISWGSKIKQNWKPLAAAAGIALFASLTTFTITNRDTRTKNSQYVLLKRDLETLKKSQNQLINDIKQNDTLNHPVAANSGLFGGSGFALSNDGYFATNYHVVEKADSIYLQMSDGSTYKASVIKVNPEADLAILKVEDSKFNYKQGLPYVIDKKVSKLGQEIFSIGYPQNEVVYNEGYVSSEKGFDGNPAAYQLEITANPGQSGAPILDNSGNIVGIITGKQSNTSGTTFAVHAEQLLEMLNDLPKGNKVSLNNRNKYSSSARPEQVKQLRSFVCAVKVF